MRVPTRSAGTRSGVNWMRLNSPEIACATVFTASVFARPGTPSTRRWPRASSATTIRSSRWSCPTMTFLISKSSRSIWPPGRVATVMLPLLLHVSVLIEWLTERARGLIDRHREADAAEGLLTRGIHETGDDADHLAVAVDQWSA